MSPEDFKRMGVRMYGRKHWRRELSVNLGLDPSTIWRMSTRDTDIPAVVEVAVKGLLEKHKQLSRAARFAAEERARAKHRYRGRLTGKKKRVSRPGRLLIRYTPKDDSNAAPEPDNPPANQADGNSAR